MTGTMTSNNVTSSMSLRLADAGYAAGWRLASKVPAAIADPLAGLAADIAARRAGPGVRQLRKNLARVVPQAAAAEFDELTRRAMRSYTRYWLEAFRLPAMDPAKVRAKVHAAITGVENIEAALADGNGAIIALPHTGNWDAAGLWLSGYFGQFTTVVERLEPPSLYERFVAFRESLGFEILPLTGSTATFRTLLTRLRENKLICLLSDRDLTASGIPVSFFGEQALMPGGPARLAASTGAALLPAGCWFTENGWAVRIHPRVRVTARAEVPAATQAVADAFAGDIAAHPTDWHMLQKVWTADMVDDVPAPAGHRGSA